MSSRYFANIKPDMTLKRSQELLAVGKDHQALQQLYDLIVKRRIKTFHASYEPIMMLFVQLCVEQRRGRWAREGLSQYRIMSQNVMWQSLENVIVHFIQCAEGKIALAKAQAGQQLEDIDDLEESETPESMLLMSYVTGEDTKDRTDRTVVTPWLKFLWEAYRSVLDILRNNNKVEVLYQKMAQRAFQFCQDYKRQTEFRRLCETLRNHLFNMSKFSQQVNGLSLNNENTLQMHLETRFTQLSTAIHLDLWQEAYRSVEDLFGMMAQSKKPPKLPLMLEYYEKVMQIFLMSKNNLMHAHAFKKYLQVWRSLNKGAMTQEEHLSQTSRCLLAALSAPLVGVSRGQYRYFDAEEQKNRDSRLASLIGMTRAPNRESLLKEMINNADALDHVYPEISQLYHILEVDFHPLQLSKKLLPIIEFLKRDPKMEVYVAPIYEVALTRILQQLAQVYKTLKFDTVVSLVPFYKPFEIEKLILESCKRGDGSIRLNHQNGTLTFNSAPLLSNADRGSQMNDLRQRLSLMSQHLVTALQSVDTASLESRLVEKSKAFEQISLGVHAEHVDALERLAILAREKEKYEALQRQREEKESRERRQREQREAELERQRRIEESQRREAQRIKKDQEEAAEKRRLQLIEDAKRRGDENIDVNISAEDIISETLRRHKEAMKEMKVRLASLAKKIDHTERAYRKEEAPLVLQDMEAQQKAESELFRKNAERKLQEARQEFQRNMEIRQRLLNVSGDAEAYREKIIAERRLKADQKKEEREQEKQKEKDARRASYEESERQKLRKQALADLKRRQDQAKKKGAEERSRKLDERAKLQQQREQEAEERQNRRERERAERDLERRKYGGEKEAFTEGWRSRAAATAASSVSRESTPPPQGPSPTASPTTSSSASSATATSKPGKYIPPALRNRQQQS